MKLSPYDLGVLVALATTRPRHPARLVPVHWSAARKLVRAHLATRTTCGLAITDAGREMARRMGYAA